MEFLPYHFEEDEETPHWWKRRKILTWDMATRTDEEATHARQHEPRVFFARMGLPDPNTSWPNPRDWPAWWWRQHDVIMASSCTVACHVSDQSADTSAQWDPPTMLSAANRLGWAE